MSQTDSENIANNHVLDQAKSYDLPAPVHLENKAAYDSGNDISPERTEESNMNCFGKCINRLRLEIACILFMFSWVMIQISSTSMILDKVCLTNYNYSHDICSNLDNYTKIKTAVEKVATNYQLGRTLIQTAPAVLISCFTGPWSDKYGRRIPMLIAIIGMSLDTIGSIFCASFLYSRVEFYLIPAVFTGCCGGLVTVLTIIYSYASDVTPAEGRTMKFAFLEMAIGFPQPLGSAAGGWIYKFWGYPSVFIVSAVGLIISFIWVCFFLPETRGKENNGYLKVKLKNLFTLETLKEGFTATVKQRPNQGRKQILLLIMARCFIVIAADSNILGCLGACASLAVRSRISKVVSNEDIGKVFSFVATAESLLPVLTTVLITQVFTASLDFYPAMPYIILAFCLIQPLGVFAWLTRLPDI